MITSASAKTPKKLVEYTAKNQLIVEENRCKGCDLCVDVCPKNVLELDKDRVNAMGYHPLICKDIASCTACGMCGQICPDSAIKIIKDV